MTEPFDGGIYGKQSGAWVPVLGLLGGSIGPVTISGVRPLQLVNPPGTANTVWGNRGGGTAGDRWALVLGNATAEGGANAGSDFSLNNYGDTGTFLGSPLFIERKTGYVTVLGQGATPAAAAAGTTPTASMRLNYGTGGSAQFVGQSNGLARWVILLGNTTAESGANAGSDFNITRFSDAGASIDTPLTINRASGQVTVGSGTTSVALNINGSVGTGRQLVGQTAGSNRWVLALGNSTAEGGSNTGSDVVFNRCNDAGVAIDAPLAITRSTGAVVINPTLRCVQGYFCQPGQGAAARANKFNIDYTGTVPQLWIDATNFGTFSFVSDYRIKRAVAPLPSMWERVKALIPVSYSHQDYSPKSEDGMAPPLIVGDDRERWGFVAHELQETLISTAATGVKDEENLLQSPNPWTVLAALTRALQEAMARIEVLEVAR